MRFRLSALFGCVTAIAILCGVVFALPIPAAILVLSCLLLISPSVWISGAVFAQRGARAFFLGGLVAGIAPFAFVAIPVVYVGVVATFGGNNVLGSLNQNTDPLLIRVIALGIWLLPGVFAFGGGGLAWLTYRMVRPASVSGEVNRGSMQDFVVAGRLTTTGRSTSDEFSG